MGCPRWKRVFADLDWALSLDVGTLRARVWSARASSFDLEGVGVDGSVQNVGSGPCGPCTSATAART